MFYLKHKEKLARLGVFKTRHGEIKTPGFMNVGTCGVIKGGVSAKDLGLLGCQVLLCNTYHLHLRPGAELIYKLGGLHKFVGWNGPILTDSGGFQVFSLAKPKNITEKGVLFSSHLDGRKLLMTPELSMQIQSNLGSTVAMAFDECVNSLVDYEYAENSVQRTTRWLVRCKEELERLNLKKETLNREQLLFGINQGAIFSKLRIKHMQKIVELELDGYAIGGLAVGETHQEMYDIISCVEPFMPQNKPRYLMGVGTPANILESVARGVDLFDCVMPSRNARHGHLFTKSGVINILNQKYALDENPIDLLCGCEACCTVSRGYLRHLFVAKEVLAMRLAVMHNLHFYNSFMAEIRSAIESDTFETYKEKNLERLSQRL